MSVVSVYVEAIDGRLYLRAFDGNYVAHTSVLDRNEAERLHAALGRIIPGLKIWEKISKGVV